MKKFFLIFVLIFGFFIRFYKVSLIPPGITMDESSVGYNAYAIAETGKDEYGKPFPISFRAFTDYKMPGYIYLAAIWVKLLGLNVLSLRISSVIFGTFSGLIIYFLALELFGKERWNLAFFSLLTYIFSPWSVLYSRAATEGIVALFLLLLGFYVQLLAFKKNKFSWLILSAIFYSAASYTYHSERVLSLLLFPSISFLLTKKFDQKFSFKKIIISILLFVFLNIPQYLLLGMPAGNTRIVNTSIIKKGDLIEIINNPIKIYSLLERQASLYFSYFSLRSLFFDPDPMKERSLPEISTFYSWMVVPFLFGLYWFLSRGKESYKEILILFLLITPVPASITKDPFATLRSLPFIFPVSIIIGLGLEKIFIYKKNFLLNKILISSIIVFYSVSILSLSRSLFKILPNEKYLDWNYGYAQLAEKLKMFPKSKVLFDDPRGDNYTEILFFLKYPPSLFQKEQNQIDLKKYYQANTWVNTYHFGTTEIRSIDWENDVYNSQIIVASPIAVSDNQAKEHFFNKVFSVTGPDGKVVFNGYLTNPELKNKSNLKK